MSLRATLLLCFAAGLMGSMGSVAEAVDGIRLPSRRGFDVNPGRTTPAARCSTALTSVIDMYRLHMQISQGGSMRASILDLRYKMKEVLRALDRNEDVTVVYHGKVKGVIRSTRTDRPRRIRDHAFFGMLSSGPTVADRMAALRAPRHAL